jgi:hypothetical protein
MKKINIFKLLKGGQEIHLFGSIDNVKFNTLPAYMTDFIMQHQKLILDHYAMSPSQSMSYDKIMEYGFINHRAERLLDGFTEEQKILLLNGVMETVVYSDCAIDSLSYKGLYNLYFLSKCMKYIEPQLVRKFEGDSKIINSFDFKEGVSTQVEDSSDFEDVTEEELKNNLQSDVLNRSKHDVFDRLMLGSYLYNVYLDDERMAEHFSVVSKLNEHWLPQIMDFDKSSIVCVDWEHLFFEHGILNQLRLCGYKIERMQEGGVFVDVTNGEGFVDIIRGHILATDLEARDIFVEVLNDKYGKEFVERHALDMDYTHLSYRWIEICSHFDDIISQENLVSTTCLMGDGGDLA